MYLTPAERRFTGSEIDAHSGPVLHRRHEQRAWEAQWFDRERADETPVRNVVAVEMRSEQGPRERYGLPRTTSRDRCIRNGYSEYRSVAPGDRKIGIAKGQRCFTCGTRRA